MMTIGGFEFAINMEAGEPVEVLMATNGGAAWVPGRVDRFVPLNVGTDAERIGVDVKVNGVVQRNCWLGSVRLPRSRDALDVLIDEATKVTQ